MNIYLWSKTLGGPTFPLEPTVNFLPWLSTLFVFRSYPTSLMVHHRLWDTHVPAMFYWWLFTEWAPYLLISCPWFTLFPLTAMPSLQVYLSVSQPVFKVRLQCHLCYEDFHIPFLPSWKLSHPLLYFCNTLYLNYILPVSTYSFNQSMPIEQLLLYVKRCAGCWEYSSKTKTHYRSTR